MAEFDESKVINALHKDKAEIGKKYYFSDTLFDLKIAVENEDINCIGLLGNIEEGSYPFAKRDLNYWEFIYPYEELPKKRMTNIQLCEWLAKGNGLLKTKLSGYVNTRYSYNKNLETEEVPDYFEIRTWDSKEWIEPTVDIYEMDCKGGK